MGSMKFKILSKPPYGIAACAFAITASREIQLFPAGEFRALDGRPKDATAWFIDAELAAAIIADLDGRDNRLVIDYEHQTLLTAENGQPAPAAGWFKQLEWREGDGLYAVDVEWTARAKQMIEAHEYKYISPVFSYDKKTGAIRRVLNAALTNNAALDGMNEVAAQAASRLLIHPTDLESLTMDMEELLKQLRWMLNLPVLATAEDILAELTKAIDIIKSAAPEAAAANFSLGAFIQANAEQIAALKVAAPDPAKFVAVQTMKALQDELAALRADVQGKEVDGLVSAALSDGRLLPAQEAWARDLGKKDLAALTAYLNTTQPVAALRGTQTGGNAPKGALDKSDPQAIANEAVKYQSEQSAIGINITTVQAVDHVTK